MTRRYHIECHIEAPREDVWRLLTDASSYRSWNSAIVSIEGDMTLRSTVRLVSTVSPKRTFKLKVVELSDPDRMVWSDGMPLGLFTGKRSFTLVERAGGTDFSMTEEFTGLLAGLITKSIPDMTESFKQFADGLKAASER